MPLVKWNGKNTPLSPSSSTARALAVLFFRPLPLPAVGFPPRLSQFPTPPSSSFLRRTLLLTSTPNEFPCHSPRPSPSSALLDRRGAEIHPGPDWFLPSVTNPNLFLFLWVFCFCCEQAKIKLFSPWDGWMLHPIRPFYVASLFGAWSTSSISFSWNEFGGSAELPYGHTQTFRSASVSAAHASGSI
jgi:hypothetical protein